MASLWPPNSIIFKPCLITACAQHRTRTKAREQDSQQSYFPCGYASCFILDVVVQKSSSLPVASQRNARGSAGLPALCSDMTKQQFELLIAGAATHLCLSVKTAQVPFMLGEISGLLAWRILAACCILIHSKMRAANAALNKASSPRPPQRAACVCVSQA